VEYPLSEDWKKCLSLYPGIEPDIIALAKVSYPRETITSFLQAFGLLKKEKLLDWPYVTPFILNGASSCSSEDMVQIKKELRGYFDFDAL
jgi:hypothetical protein